MRYRHPYGRSAVGGSITWVDDAPVRHLARFSAYGVRGPAFVQALHSNVDELVLDSQGRTCEMRRFSRAGDESQPPTVRVLDDATGTVDCSFQSEAPAGNAISGFALLVDEAAGALYAARGSPRRAKEPSAHSSHQNPRGERKCRFDSLQ